MDSGRRLEVEQKVCVGERLTREDGMTLLDSDDLSWLGRLADRVRRGRHGDQVSFVVNRRIDASADPARQVANLATEHVTELHLAADPALPWPRYPDLLRSLKRAAPGVRLIAFTSADLDRFAVASGASLEAVLDELMAAGLDALAAGNPAAWAAPDDGWERWAAVHRLAHAKGMTTGATLHFATPDEPSQRIDRLLRLRDLQDDTGGFTTVTPLLTSGEAPASPIDGLRMVAVSRVVLDNLPHVAANWPTLGLSVALLSLQFGVDDLDVAGIAGGAPATPTPDPLTRDELVELIHDAGFRPVERDGRHAVVREYPAPPSLAERRSIPQQVWS
ncbi:MAG TPA: aminofutalosine synthase MqnE [Micromonosporaceae bacterium]|nr:aminofutalosine synthase MqnE [Micromonosporaceae bacterium]